VGSLRLVWGGASSTGKPWLVPVAPPPDEGGKVLGTVSILGGLALVDLLCLLSVDLVFMILITGHRDFNYLSWVEISADRLDIRRFVIDRYIHLKLIEGCDSENHFHVLCFYSP